MRKIRLVILSRPPTLWQRLRFWLTGRIWIVQRWDILDSYNTVIAKEFNRELEKIMIESVRVPVKYWHEGDSHEDV